MKKTTFLKAIAAGAFLMDPLITAAARALAAGDAWRIEVLGLRARKTAR